jgi:radical SAM superfamily enzyme YgiQ (UPF0313 family)
MRVALLHYEVARLANEPGNKTVMKHFGLMPSIQLLYVAATMERLPGVELAYYDMAAMNLDEAALARKLKAFNPDMVGLSVYTSHFHNAKSWAKFCKQALPGVKVLIGGVHTSIFPTETLKHCPEFDYACVGEAEMVYPEFFRRLQGNESLEGLRGLAWRDGGRISYAGLPDLCQDLDAVPFPARRLIPNEKYFNFISTKRNYTIFNTSRGCPFRCVFCEAGGQKWRARSAANIVLEIEECYEKYGIREIDIFDSSFTISKKRVLETCRLLRENGLAKKIIWNVRSRVDTVDEEMLDALKEAGCYRIFYGIESSDPAVLANLNKDIELSRVERVIGYTDKIGVSGFGYFLVGAPGDTRGTIQGTIDFAKKLPLDFAIFNCLTPFPMTELYEKYYLPIVKRDFWADYIARAEADLEFVGRPWMDIPNEELQMIAHKAMNSYYFRPRQLWRALKSIGSWDQFKRYCAAGADMALSYLKKSLS